MARQTVSELVVVVGSDVQEALSGLNQIGVGAQKFGRDLQRTGRTLTTHVTAPILGVGAASFKMAGDLEQSFAKMEGLVGVQREQLDAWEGDVRSLAVTYGKSATDAADALFFITSAGLEGSDAMDALEASLKASASGLGETATIADLVTSAMNAYGPGVLSAAQATDVLTAAVREGKLEPDALAGSMGRVIPVASAMGISFDEVGAAMAAMSRTGTQADEAATQLRGIMTALLKPTTEADDALSAMGLSAEGLRTQVRERGLLSTLQTLSDRFEGNDAAAAQVFGNVRALSGVMDLMGANAAGTAEIFGSLEDSTGALDAAFAAMSSTAKFDLSQGIAAVLDLLVEFGNAVLPVVSDVLRDAIPLVRDVGEWFGNLEPKTQKAIVVVAGLAAGVGPLVVVLGTLISTTGVVVGAIGTFGPALATVTAALGLFAAAVLLPIKNMKALLAKTGEVKTDLVEAWGGFRDFVTEVFEAVGVDITGFMDFLEDMARWVEEKLGFVVRFFGRFRRDTRSEVRGMVDDVDSELVRLPPILDETSDYWARMAGEIADSNAGIVTSTGETAGEVTDVWELMWDAMQAKTVSTKNKVLTELYYMRQEFDATVSGMIDDSLKEFARIEIEAPPITGRVTQEVVEDFEDMHTGVLDRVGGIVTDVASKFGEMEGEIDSEIGGLPSFLQGKFGEIREALKLGQGGFDVASEISNWISLADGIIGAIRSIADYLSSRKGKGVLDFLGNIATAPGPQFGQNPSGGDNPFQGQPVFVGGGLPSGATVGVGSLHLEALAVMNNTLGRIFSRVTTDGPINNNLVEIRDSGFTRNMVLGQMRDGLSHAVDYLRQMAEAPTLMAPQPAMAMAGGGGGGTTVQVTNQFYGNMTGLNEAEISRAVTDRTIEEVDRVLGQKARTDRIFLGDAS